MFEPLSMNRHSAGSTVFKIYRANYSYDYFILDCSTYRMVSMNKS